MLTDREWDAVDDLVKILKPFDDITTYMSASTYPTISIVFPTIIALRNTMISKHGETAKGKETAIRTEDDEHAFDGDLGYEDSPDDEDEPGRPKRRKIKINDPVDTTHLVERVTGAMCTLFVKYYSVSSIDRFACSFDPFACSIN